MLNHNGESLRMAAMLSARRRSIFRFVVPNAVTTQTINGVTSTTTGINLTTKPQWKQSTAGAATQFHESYIGPGLNSYVHIDRTIEVQSVTESTSTFTQ